MQIRHACRILFERWASFNGNSLLSCSRANSKINRGRHKNVDKWFGGVYCPDSTVRAGLMGGFGHGAGMAVAWCWHGGIAQVFTKDFRLFDRRSYIDGSGRQQLSD